MARVESASNRNEYQCYLLGGKYVGLTTLPPNVPVIWKIWEPQPPGALWACSDMYRSSFTFIDSALICRGKP